MGGKGYQVGLQVTSTIAHATKHFPSGVYTPPHAPPLSRGDAPVFFISPTSPP